MKTAEDIIKESFLSEKMVKFYEDLDTEYNVIYTINNIVLDDNTSYEYAIVETRTFNRSNEISDYMRDHVVVFNGKSLSLGEVIWPNDINRIPVDAKSYFIDLAKTQEELKEKDIEKIKSFFKNCIHFN